VREVLSQTAADGDAAGRARLTLSTSSEGRFEIIVRGLDPDASYEVVVRDVRVATLTTTSRGRARVRFRTRPRGSDLALGFDPRGAAVVVRKTNGDDVLVSSFPDVASGDAGDVVCCLSDDSGPECEDRTPAECAAQGGAVVAGATSCLPNPCAGASPVDDEGDTICCLPDDSGTECEDRTQAECLGAGGSVVNATSCTPNPCAPTPPTGGEIICCLPDNGGDGAMECEDLSADACTAAGGTVSTATSCTPDPCAAGTPGGGGGPGPATVLVTCERRASRSKISVDGSNLAAGSYQARALSGAESTTTAAQATIGDQVEFDFDSDPGDIAAGATPIAEAFIVGTPPQVTGQILDVGGGVVVESTVTCTEQ
jgi:hypothetical protein